MAELTSLSLEERWTCFQKDVIRETKKNEKKGRGLEKKRQGSTGGKVM